VVAKPPIPPPIIAMFIKLFLSAFIVEICFQLIFQNSLVLSQDKRKNMQDGFKMLDVSL
jgi:hypothetical protein